MKRIVIALLTLALLTALTGCSDELQSLMDAHTSDPVIIYPETAEVPLVEPTLNFYNHYFGLTLDLPASFSILRAPNVSTKPGADDLSEFDSYRDKDNWVVYELIVFKNHDDSAFDDYCECTIVAVSNPENYSIAAYADRLVESVTTKIIEPSRQIVCLGIDRVDIQGVPYTQVSFMDTEPGFYDFYQEVYITQIQNHFLVVSLYYNYEVSGRPGQKVAQRIINEYIAFS